MSKSRALAAPKTVYACFLVPLQFFLGTTRLQLEHKGDTAHHFTAFANIIPAFGFLGIPFMTWLLDKKGYGATLATINFLTVLASLFEAMPSLRFQVQMTRLSSKHPDLPACTMNISMSPELPCISVQYKSA